MDQSQLIITKWKIHNLRDATQVQALTDLLRGVTGVTQVDVNLAKGLVRIIASQTVDLQTLRQRAVSLGLELSNIESEATAVQEPVTGEITKKSSEVLKLAIEGMHCRSCELVLEKRLKLVPGVGKVDANAAKGTARIVCSDCTPDLKAIEAAVAQEGYKLKGLVGQETKMLSERPTFGQLIGMFVIVFVAGIILSELGLLKPNVGIGPNTGLLGVFLLGLVAASSSCIAVAGGVLLASIARFEERAGSLSPKQRMQPVFLFVAGRLAGYGVLGGLIGFIGKSLSPSPFVTGGITLLAAVYMLVMGLEMLHLAPAWMRSLMPRMPKTLARGVMSSESSHPLSSAVLGAGTFFLPCGFTQALQLYALTTGSVLTSAALLFTFALGTAPALLALGWSSSALKGNVGKMFFRFAGATVTVLGLWNLQNGLTIMGYPLELPSLSYQAPAAVSAAEATGGEQLIKMTIGYGGYEPNRFTLKAGVPTRWEVDAQNAGGCLSVLQAPQLGIRKLLAQGETNFIDFTPQTPGTYTFSCSMGMFRGQIVVEPNS